MFYEKGKIPYLFFKETIKALKKTVFKDSLMTVEYVVPSLGSPVI